jgi:hypothetical protein
MAVDVGTALAGNLLEFTGASGKCRGEATGLDRRTAYVVAMNIVFTM